jgi:hypothetical protein
MQYYNIERNMLKKYQNANVCLLYDYMINNYRFIDEEIWIDEKRFVHFSMKDFNDNLYLSDKLIRKYLDVLKNDNQLEIKRFGIPSKNYYYIPYCNNDKFIGGY